MFPEDGPGQLTAFPQYFMNALMIVLQMILCITVDMSRSACQDTVNPSVTWKKRKQNGEGLAFILYNDEIPVSMIVHVPTEKIYLRGGLILFPEDPLVAIPLPS